MVKSISEMTSHRASPVYRLTTIFLALVVVGYGAYIWSQLQAADSVADQLRRMSGDFAEFYAAAITVGSDTPQAVYDDALMYGLESKLKGVDRTRLPWRYPPVFLVMIAFLAKFNYLTAWLLWLAGTLVGAALVIQAWGGFKTAWLFFLSFTGTYLNLLYGQNGFLSLMFLGGGLLLLPQRPFLAGLALGCLAYKPHLAWLVPLALVGGRHWSALTGCLVSGLVLCASSLAAYGWPIWSGFLAVAPQAMADARSGAAPFSQMPTVLAAIRLIGLGDWVALGAQALAILTAGATVLWSWRKSIDHDIKCGLLVAAALLAAPHAFGYDLALLALPLIIMADRLNQGRGSLPTAALLALGWAGPLIGLVAAVKLSLPLTAPILVALFIYFVALAGRARPD